MSTNILFNIVDRSADFIYLFLFNLVDSLQEYAKIYNHAINMRNNQRLSY